MADKSRGRVATAESPVIEAVCARVRDRVDGDLAEYAEEFARQYYGHLPAEDLAERDPLDLYGAALAHLDFGRHREPGETKVRVYNPEFDQHGWKSTHTVAEIVSDDMPFLVDSVSMELSRLGAALHLMIHPVIGIQRDERGDLVAVSAPAPGEPAESFIHIEFDRHGEATELEEIRASLLLVLAQVRAAVDDWAAMRARLAALVGELRAGGPSAEDAEAAAFLQWMDAGNFVFLGYREYTMAGAETEEEIHTVPGTGLGILRSTTPDRPSGAFARLSARARRLVHQPDRLILTKANARATVHRPSYLDYVGIRQFGPDGETVGECRFLGLYTTAAYREPVGQVPVLRRKIAAVLARAGYVPGSHADKALHDILETYPRDELLQISTDELYTTTRAILALGERQRVRLFVRRDRFDRFVSCLVFLPRDRFNTQNRERIQDILSEAFDGRSIDFELRLSESVLVRLLFVVRVRGNEIPDHDAAAIERRIDDVTRSWSDELRDALLEEVGEQAGNELFRSYREAFPAGYRENSLPRSAVADIRRLDRLTDTDAIAVSLYRPLEAQPGALRCRLYRRGDPVALSEVFPMFQHLGLRVREERPWQVTPRDAPAAWLYDFGLAYEGEIDFEGARDRFHDAFVRIWRGEVEDDGLNALVLAAGLDAHDVTVLRAIARYLRQAGIPFSDRYMEHALLAHPAVAAGLVDLFHARFAPARAADREDAEAVAARLEEEIDAVESLDEDRILRGFLTVLRALLRTNYFQRGPTGERKPYLSFKLDPTRVLLLPLPRPRFEIFVCSPAVEGVHLRGGAVARGGLRWSDRREDFRTEVLGLMKAQMVKNALIVPVGAKGGFVVKRPPADRALLRDEVVACYSTFIEGLLDVTDNVVAGEVVPPPDVVRHDGDDPYLVVAADKGTATFSDIANGIARSRGFWLGDAFASGGSAGYDHKAMGITARSAWVSVRRHFRELGLDVDTEDFTVVGVGDMSGDVFGNGMLCSEHIRLIGAFDHRHVFLDPDPDAAASFAERRRLYALPGSSWDDYDRALISEGGGVWPRSAKSIPLTAPAQRALGVEHDRLTPAELMRALLRAPVDLFWNGGIGTYVKARAESHADAGDKSNDAVRADAADLRCRVVGEGGNLGFTQRGRIEFAAAGGRINTDAIDNAGGVNCSDHEVNIKILLDAVVAAGDLTEKQRNRLLAEMTDAVAERVLRGSYLQTQSLSLARAQASSMLDVHDRMIRRLEQTGRLDRALEALPDADAIGERHSAGLGFTQPELAVLLAYAKIVLYAALLESDLPEDPYLAPELPGYFPAPLPERYGDRLREHRLRREIVATLVTNDIVDHGGTTFAFRLQEETGESAAAVARAYAVARDVFELPGLWADVEALDGKVEADVQTEMLLEARRLVERATRWLLRHSSRPFAGEALRARLAPGIAAVASVVPGVLVEDEREEWRAGVAARVAAGVPEALAGRAQSLRLLFGGLDICDVSLRTSTPIEEVAELYFLIGGNINLHWLRDRIALLPRDDRWKAMARASLRDDAFELHAELTASVLTGGDGVVGAERLEAWIEQHRDRVERATGILTEIRQGGPPDLATLAVALRELRDLIQAAKTA